ncbi:MarR family transcriptional regulator [Lactobacillus sp. LL6]|uniref:MarR family winged helix-turn-helix transcriptional regulator n=1 Tax=Lactobacillus sp. LL6 TaxID=2596827 RepID=UPI0011861630|nr:MarR family transcriptional regulator [Lactobacillus sp. LL6]TSO26691.1 MarR family transcriptional regulator [Lactobacillus sp. LL6]
MTTKLTKFNELNQILRLYMINSHRLFSKYTENLNLTPQQSRTLSYIERHPGIIQRELADNFHLRGASASNMLKNLERDGYIIRKNDPASARVKRIYLTQYGQKTIVSIRKAFSKINDDASHDLDEEQLDELIHLLKNLNKHLEDFIDK